jgi:hypothetical protein
LFGSISEIIDDLKSHTEQVISLKKRWLGLKLLRQRLGDDTINYKPFGGYELFLRKMKAVITTVWLMCLL